jgi:hypothetical protein
MRTYQGEMMRKVYIWIKVLNCDHGYFAVTRWFLALQKFPVKYSCMTAKTLTWTVPLTAQLQSHTYELCTFKQNCFSNLGVFVLITMNLPSSTFKTSHTVPTWKEEAVPWSIKTNCTKTPSIITGFTIT